MYSLFLPGAVSDEIAYRRQAPELTAADTPVSLAFFAGAFAYADDVVLLAPCAAALRIMLSICSRFALSHKLEFNASKTKLL